MKTLTQRILVATSLAMALVVGSTNRIASQTIEIGRNFAQDPLQIQGQSGGGVDSKGCGFIAETPNQVIEVKERINYMRLSVENTGSETTLLVDGPDGRFCVLANELAGISPEISGVWLEGKYEVYIGELKGGQNQFTLNISQTKPSTQ